MISSPSTLNLAVAAILFTLLPLIAHAEGPGVAPQYDSTHVYVQPEQVPAFVAAFTAVLGGGSKPQSVSDVTPTPSSTTTQIVQTPSGPVSLFGFKTPIPYPFGAERTGYLVTDMDAAVAQARAAGAVVVVAPFPDPIGRDAVIQWPGGVMMQLYWHTKTPTYPPLATTPENRVYVSPDAADAFVRGWISFSHGRVLSDEANAPGSDLGRVAPFRRIRVESPFGKLTVLVTDGALPLPYGREIMGYEVADLSAALRKATAAGVDVLSGPTEQADRTAAMVRFPGGYIAELHALRR